jgi:S1-C subfamily serine protease
MILSITHIPDWAFYYVDGRVIVEDIIPGSPGDKAGFKSGDIILGVNKQLH